MAKMHIYAYKGIEWIVGRRLGEPRKPRIHKV
jgi:hypothetical protein